MNLRQSDLRKAGFSGKAKIPVEIKKKPPPQEPKPIPVPPPSVTVLPPDMTDLVAAVREMNTAVRAALERPARARESFTISLEFHRDHERLTKRVTAIVTPGSANNS